MKNLVIFMLIFAAFSIHAEDKHKKAAEERQKKKASLSPKEWKEYLKEEKAKRDAVKAKRETKKKEQESKQELLASKNAKKQEVTPVIQEEKQTQVVTEDEIVAPEIEKETNKNPGVIKPKKVEKKIFI
ncbi:hypothetical protein PQO01_06640 [Lentisphaera marina]|uniref:hypothetical protein n=1 Tax=Lentisphaera marina TaxID=1111041 RepID=UPI00236525BE|nr:hypothetical protein [Lentisphaera marina]MDD7984624.1 hypothetical protein [Lentisphaera marina]